MTCFTFWKIAKYTRTHTRTHVCIYMYVCAYNLTRLQLPISSLGSHSTFSRDTGRSCLLIRKISLSSGSNSL